MLVVSDGKSNIQAKDPRAGAKSYHRIHLNDAVKMSKDKGTLMIAVGVGGNYDLDELRTIATNRRDVRTLDQFDLSLISQSVANIVCQTPPPSSAPTMAAPTLYPTMPTPLPTFPPKLPSQPSEKPCGPWPQWVPWGPIGTSHGDP